MQKPVQNYPKVFVVQQPKPNGRGWTPNLQPATQFGALHFIFDAEHRPNLNPQDAVQLCFNALKNFRADMDFLLYPNSGDPAGLYAAIIALTTLCDLTHINFLYWERNLDAQGERQPNSGFYLPIKFTLNHHSQERKGEIDGNKI